MRQTAVKSQTATLTPQAFVKERRQGREDWWATGHTLIGSSFQQPWLHLGPLGVRPKSDAVRTASAVEGIVSRGSRLCIVSASNQHPYPGSTRGRVKRSRAASQHLQGGLASANPCFAPLIMDINRLEDATVTQSQPNPFPRSTLNPMSTSLERVCSRPLPLDLGGRQLRSRTLLLEKMPHARNRSVDACFLT